MFIINKTRESL